MNNNFEHRHAAHCESGVVSSLLRDYGINISEPMVFGLSSAITFAHFPFLKMSGMPFTSYRMPPKAIIKGVQKNLGIKFKLEKFSSEEKGMARLDELLKERIVGLQTSVFFLSYFPKDMRFHFNGHNLVAIEKKDDKYVISDPVFEELVEASSDELRKARFAKGILAPKGLTYYPVEKPSEIDYKKAIVNSIKKTCKIMLQSPIPLVGVKGIRYLAKNIKKLPVKHKDRVRYQKMYLSHIIRMQEEIGTGGAGFRFLYAAFLQEASAHYPEKAEALKDFSKKFTEIGEEWRTFAVHCARMVKGREAMDANKISDILNKCADLEEAAFKEMKKEIRLLS